MKNGGLVKDGELGEIQVRSQYCALGYWKDENLTNQYFVFHQDGSRTIKTGDFGKLNSKGLLEFKGRKDNQIKINGFRIEVAEIESVIRRSFGVIDAAIIVRKLEDKNKLTVYVQLDKSVTLDFLKKELLNKLSDYMYPSFFYEIEEIPYLSNFKIDYKYIKQLDESNVLNEEYSFQNKIDNKSKYSGSLFIDERILKYWCKYASYQSFQEDLTWKMGGGSSLDVIHFIFAIEQEFNVDFPEHLINDGIKPSLIKMKVHEFIEN